jgi:nicotinate-nucleotide adenylyltransferase
VAGARHRTGTALNRGGRARGRGGTARRIGLLGGSFNPAHSGHRYISMQALRALDLDEVWWLVSPGNPLKADHDDMAPFAARMASARAMARHAPIRPSAVEKRLRTRYTVDTLAKLPRLYPRHRFIWLMGSDNLAQFHEWKGWRRIASHVPIAVIARPGYSRDAHASPAMSWLRRYVRPAGQAKNWTDWRLPALVLLRFRPDPTSATRLRAADPAWHRRYAPSREPSTDRSEP